MIRFVPAVADRLARLALALLALLGLASIASCGSGAVSGAPAVNDPTRITILPAVATVFSGIPTTFVISGGTGSYFVSSSNQAIIRVAGSVTGGSLTVTPEPVTADTVITLTVRDTGATPLASATVTVKPGTVSNSITITPSSTQGPDCPAGTLCSGGDAVVTATLSQGGSPLPGQAARFEVVSGSFLFITSQPGATTETFATSVTVISDELGRVTARIRANPDAVNQTALLQVTHLGTGAFQRTSFVIAQATGSSPGFIVTPDQVTFQGRLTNQCATSGINATVYIFGGTPPYTVNSTTSAFVVSRDFVSFSGGSFTVTPNGTCVGAPGLPIVVRDAAGRTTSVLVANIPGTEEPPALSVAPEAVTLRSCSGSANVTIAGGRPNPDYFVSSGSDSVIATISGNTVTIRRRPGSPAAATVPPGSPPGTEATATVNVGVSDGISSENITVTLTGPGAGVCLGATPASVILTSCISATTVSISGGSGAYTAVSNHTSVSAIQTSPSSFRIQRTPGSLAYTPPTTVTVTDTGDPTVTLDIPVNAGGSGRGNC